MSVRPDARNVVRHAGADRDRDARRANGRQAGRGDPRADVNVNAQPPICRRDASVDRGKLLASVPGSAESRCCYRSVAREVSSTRSTMPTWLRTGTTGWLFCWATVLAHVVPAAGDDAAQTAPHKVVVELKVVQVYTTKLRNLGFDWAQMTPDDIKHGPNPVTLGIQNGGVVSDGFAGFLEASPRTVWPACWPSRRSSPWTAAKLYSR